MKLIAKILNSITFRIRALARAAVLICLIGGIPSGRLIADPATQTTQWEDDDAVRTIEALNKQILTTHRANFGFYMQVRDVNEEHRRDTSWKLLQMFKDQAAANGARVCAANYLGELRMENAINDLTSQIAFRCSQVVINTHGINDIPDFAEFPAQQALIRIGIASIPALIGNLAGSDDAETRKLSLEAIYKIEGDKDIVQIRLQKALKAETDSKKQARLQAALKALDEAKF
jgi:hypothetical protein